MIITNSSDAAQLLRQGKLVAIPTETVYGLAANAFNSNAVAEIFAAKNRPFFDPLIVHTHSMEAIGTIAQSIPQQAYDLFTAFAPGPITVVLPKADSIPDIVTAGLPTVGVRIPNHPITLELLSELDFPLAAPSANPFGYVSPTTAIHVEQQLGAKIAAILDGGACQVGLESTIIGFENDKPVIYRLGGLSIEAIERVVGRVELSINQSSNPTAPGQLKSHYAPSVKLYIQGTEADLDYSTCAYIGFDTLHPAIPQANQLLLSPTGNLTEAAQKLFAALRTLETMGVTTAIAAVFPNEGLGLAINDRLKRASA